jgi:1-acyl-sn-glycerol-3-phosphate acyltransferase
MNTLGIDRTHPFVANLLATCHYRTPQAPKPVFLATWRYYKGILTVIKDSSWIARNGQFSNQDWFNRAYYTIKTIERIGGTLEVSGLEHLAKQTGPVVVLANHMSLLETFLFPALLIPFTPMCVVVKKELTELPGFGKAMSAANHIAVSRTNPRDDFRIVMEQGTAFLKAGISVLIFPQSTRNSVFIPSEFNTLGEKLAAKAGVPVIPVAVKTDLHGNGRLLKEFGPVNAASPVRVAFGPAIDPQKEGRLAHDKVIAFISGHLRGWGLPVQEAPPAPKADS